MRQNNVIDLSAYLTATQLPAESAPRPTSGRNAMALIESAVTIAIGLCVVASTLFFFTLL